MNKFIVRIPKGIFALFSLFMLLPACGGSYEHGESTNLETSEVPVISIEEDRIELDPASLPKSAGQEIVVTLSDTDFYVPPRTRGDDDFSGNGPQVWVNAKLYIKQNKELWVDVYMKAKEDQSDWTTAEGTKKYLMSKNHGVILDILSDTYTSGYYYDHDHGLDVLTMGDGELVNKFYCYGDTWSSDAGVDTRVSVKFNPVRIRISNGSCGPRGIHCGGKGSDETCWCDNLCERYGDCCADYNEQCS